MNKLSLTIVMAAALAHAAFASVQFSTVHTFTCAGDAELREGTCANGGRAMSLIQGSDGNIYDTAFVSSEGSSQPNGGTIFSISATGSFRLLHTFLPGVDNNYPEGNNPGFIMEGPDGNLYGTTIFGGTTGRGILYRISRSGSGFQVLHQFCSLANCTDGGTGGNLVVASDGNIYGSTSFGGTFGPGAIFRVVPSTGTYKVVFSFNGTTSGSFPGGLTLGPDKTLYGLSSGALFHFVPATGMFQSFPARFPDIQGLPSAANSGLVWDAANQKFYGLYSVYSLGGSGLFEIDVNGTNFKLFPEYDKTNNGGVPEGMVLASDGNFWIANESGSSGFGNVVTLSINGTLVRTVGSFSVSSSLGAFPVALVQMKDGTLRGTSTQYGTAPSGNFGDGVVFKLSAGLPPL